MRAMVKIEAGGGLELRQVENPKVKDEQVLIKVVAAGVNRCDMLLQNNNTEIEADIKWSDSSWLDWDIDDDDDSDAVPKRPATCPGHACSGIITAIGRDVHEWKVGDKVCAFLDGGGYAEEVVVSAKQLLPVPCNVSLADAASLPYEACNAWLALSSIPEYSLLFPRSKTILIHVATTSFGVMAIQVAKCKGFKVIATSESRDGTRLCHALGADLSINTITGEKVGTISEDIHGVDVELDNGFSNDREVCKPIKIGGTRLIVDFDGEGKSLGCLAHFIRLSLRLQVINLRTQSTDEKASIVAEVRRNIWPAIEEGKVKPVIGRRLPLAAASAARQLLNSEQVRGSVLLYP